MHLLTRLRQGELRLDRIEAFSDLVFAIVATLLVLQLRLPSLQDPLSASELGYRLLQLLPKFLTWLIAFAILCKFWLNHHHVLGLARHGDYGLVWLNALFLLGQTFIPFPTGLMGEYPNNSLAVSAFGVAMAVNMLLFIALHAYILNRLIKPELVAAQYPDIVRKSFVGVFAYLIGAVAAWFSVHAAFGAYLLTPLFFIVPPTRPVLSKPGMVRKRARTERR